MPRRQIVTVSFDAERKAWLAPCSFARKSDAVKAAAESCRRALERGELAELRIKGKSGRVQDARTYGADPRRTKG